MMKRKKGSFFSPFVFLTLAWFYERNSLLTMFCHSISDSLQEAIFGVDLCTLKSSFDEIIEAKSALEAPFVEVDQQLCHVGSADASLRNGR